VPREKIYNAMALNNLGANIAAVAGPALSGILIGIIGVQGAYFVGVGFYVVAIIVMAALPATSKLGRYSGGSMLTNLKEGLRYLRLQRMFIILLIMELALTLFGMCYQGLIPVFAELLNQKSQGYGFMLAFVGVGSMMGSLAIASLGNFKKKGLVLIGAGIFFGIVLVLFANTAEVGNIFHMGSSSMVMASFLLILIGMFSTAYATTSSTIIQMNVSDEFRGRITSVYSMVIGFYPVSTLIIGAVAEVLGAPMALTIGGGCLAVFTIFIALFSRRFRGLE
jgi:predicted MFS family arabinose efflux permease